MPRGAWTNKDERQYKHIFKSCMAASYRGKRVCQRIAAATVNKYRSHRRRARRRNRG